VQGRPDDQGYGRGRIKEKFRGRGVPVNERRPSVTKKGQGQECSSLRQGIRGFIKGVNKKKTSSKYEVKNLMQVIKRGHRQPLLERGVSRFERELKN